MDSVRDIAEEQDTETFSNTGMSVDRMATLSVFAGVIALFSYIVAFSFGVLPAHFQIQLACIFGMGTWVAASIASFGLAFSSLGKIRSSLNPKKVRRQAIGALVGNGLLWALTCALIAYVISSIPPD